MAARTKVSRHAFARAAWSLLGLCAAAALLWSGAEGPRVSAEQAATATPGANSSQSPTSLEAAYWDWLAGQLARQTAAIQAVPSTFDLGSPSWRREQALALDTWGSLIQEARDRRPPASAQPLHTTLLDGLDRIDRARRLLLVAVATGQEPGPDVGAQLRAGRQTLDDVAERARASSAGRPTPPALASFTSGDLRVVVLAVTRPYLDRGNPLDPAWEYVVLRLRLENVGADPLTYDANQFRLRSVDETLHSPVPLGMADELYYGALEGNRLASGVVGTLAYAVRRGVPTVALYYEKQPGEVALRLPVGDLVPLVFPTPTPARRDPRG